MHPYSIMWLKDDEWMRFQEKVVIKVCPMCGADGLEFSRAAIVTPGPPVKPGLPRASEARLKVTCASCGYIMEFDAAAFGVRVPAV